MDWRRHLLALDHRYSEIFHGSALSHEPNLHCVLVYDNGHTWEHYAGKAHSDELISLYSITKSFVALGFYRAIQELGESILQESVLPLLQDRILHKDSRKEKWTIQHLLSQTSGLKWREMGAKWGEGNPLYEMENSKDWVSHVLSQPCIADPGRHFNYSSGVSHLLPTWIAKKFKTSSDVFFVERVLYPLHIDSFRWDTDPQEELSGGRGLWLKGSDLLNAGIQLLDYLDWFTLCFSNRVRAMQSIGDYGLHWWLGKEGEFIAMGFGGKLLYLNILKRKVVVVLGNMGKNSFFLPLEYARMV